MKKIFTFVVAVLAAVNLSAWEYENPGFQWSAGTDVTTSYLWRGLKLGGLAFQPDAMVGYGGLQLEAWANLSPKDWSFQEFTPELDMTLKYSIAGFTVGATHYYYFDGTKYFDYTTPSLADYEAGTYATNQTEVFASFDLSELVEDVPLSFLWATTVGGDDWIELYEDAADPDKLTGIKRAFSSYFEISYAADLPLGFTLTPTVGFTPWKSMYNFYERDFSVNNISLKLAWGHDFKDYLSFEVYALGMLNTAGINKSNVITGIRDSYNNQRLNGCIGLSVYFGNAL